MIVSESAKVHMWVAESIKTRGVWLCRLKQIAADARLMGGVDEGAKRKRTGKGWEPPAQLGLGSPPFPNLL